MRCNGETMRKINDYGDGLVFLHAMRRPRKKGGFAAALLLLLSSALFAEPRKFSDRLMLDLGAQAQVPFDQPTGLGGGLGLGYEARDFNLFLRGAGMIAEPGKDSRNLSTLVLRPEFRVGLSPSFITLLPYIDLGIISARLKRPQGRGMSGSIATLYAAAGLGMEILLSHELSFISRLGVAHAFIADDNDSNNFSGPTLELAVRYTFGRSRQLDY